MSDKEEKTTEERLSENEDRIVKLSDKIESFREMSKNFTKLKSVHDDMVAAITKF